MTTNSTDNQPGDISQQSNHTSSTTDDERRRQQERTARKIQAYFLHFLFLFQGVTQIYVTEYYLLDLAFREFSPLVRTGLRIWAWHICLVGTVNWVCILYYRNDYNPSSPPAKPAQNTTTSTPSNVTHHDDHNDSSSLVEDGSERSPLPWTFCQRCNMDTPPRTRHCKKCERCVVRRDHHCELVGCCIGHRNQRFFVVLASYGIVVTYFGSYMSVCYLYHHHPEGASVFNYFLPVSFVLWLIGEVSTLQLLLTYHAMMLIIFIPLTTVYFLSEMSIILQGKTMREVMKKMKHIKVTTSVKDNLRVAFGDYWYLNFVFPLHFVFPQKHNGMEFEGVTIGPAPASYNQKLEDKKQF